ncbi:hypothetical protein A3I18_01770 [Candidatus Campbellbacteria bacterium RIFCSPLOWO2_02_FULL_35_11]|uniref:Prepilin-type N-terminal cleavage/methylation domain-containing protein n=2 Tax=Candidatus Campbelliibacteriota TaxID=1752727 RepID=A0A1F5EQN6_9BACT|nr:MAG: hypothetical protein A3E89_01995 [Candidatus Campbellbacteria bacterium RIFCSPHIGHO2_12_FULL_35_10]OGD69936.1 MAG: hypothetical protein A3I18_01770 [Candidatus Campbellbacteria bacterium RIFCSPLOWO2_02_FULL_35_11]
MTFFVKRNSGFSMIEVLIYISVLVLVMFIVVNSILMMLSSYTAIKVSQKVNETASGILERISLETKRSNGLALSGNVLNNDAGSINLNVVKDDGSIIEKKFWLDGTDLKMQEFGGEVFVLNIPGVEVERFFVNYVSAGSVNLIKIEMELHSQKKNVNKNEIFYISVVMRESY